MRKLFFWLQSQKRSCLNILKIKFEHRNYIYLGRSGAKALLYTAFYFLQKISESRAVYDFNQQKTWR